MKTVYTIILICVFIAFVIFGVFYLKKTSTQSVNLSSSDNNQTTNLSVGEKINLTLSNPGDGGYQFEDPVFDASILKLISHTHSDATNNQALGNFGNDTWTFETLKQGQTNLAINISRPWETNQSETYFQAQIIVQ